MNFLSSDVQGEINSNVDRESECKCRNNVDSKSLSHYVIIDFSRKYVNKIFLPLPIASKSTS